MGDLYITLYISIFFFEILLQYNIVLFGTDTSIQWHVIPTPIVHTKSSARSPLFSMNITFRLFNTIVVTKIIKSDFCTTVILILNVAYYIFKSFFILFRLLILTYVFYSCLPKILFYFSKCIFIAYLNTFLTSFYNSSWQRPLNICELIITNFFFFKFA